MPVKSEKTGKKEIVFSENREINTMLMNNFDKFSVEALMMKQENFPAISSVLGQEGAAALTDANNSDAFAQLGLQQTFQNLKNLFVNYSMNNVSN